MPINVFPAWARLNDVDFAKAKLEETEGKGFGLTAAKDLKQREKGKEVESGDEGDTKDGKNPKTTTTTKLLSIPHDLILSAEAVKQYANVDQNFRQLLDAAGHQVNTQHHRHSTAAW